MIKNMIFKLLLKMNGDVLMMALLLTQRIILDKMTFEQVPNSLKPQVYNHLLDSGVEYLAGDYVPQ